MLYRLFYEEQKDVSSLVDFDYEKASHNPHDFGSDYGGGVPRLYEASLMLILETTSANHCIMSIPCMCFGRGHYRILMDMGYPLSQLVLWLKQGSNLQLETVHSYRLAAYQRCLLDERHQRLVLTLNRLLSRRWIPSRRWTAVLVAHPLSR